MSSSVKGITPQKATAAFFYWNSYGVSTPFCMPSINTLNVEPSTLVNCKVQTVLLSCSVLG